MVYPVASFALTIYTQPSHPTDERNESFLGNEGEKR